MKKKAGGGEDAGAERAMAESREHGSAKRQIRLETRQQNPNVMSLPAESPRRITPLGHPARNDRTIVTRNLGGDNDCRRTRRCIRPTRAALNGHHLRRSVKREYGLF